MLSFHFFQISSKKIFYFLMNETSSKLIYEVPVTHISNEQKTENDTIVLLKFIWQIYIKENSTVTTTYLLQPINLLSFMFFLVPKFFFTASQQKHFAYTKNNCLFPSVQLRDNNLTRFGWEIKRIFTFQVIKKKSLYLALKKKINLYIIEKNA